MSDTVKEEELADIERLDQHSEACGHDSYQSDDIEDADDLEHDVSWARQVFLEERHC